MALCWMRLSEDERATFAEPDQTALGNGALVKHQSVYKRLFR
jgi:hypothetical protein